MAKEPVQNLGSGGYCICPKCEKRIPHESGNPCKNIKCPDCGKVMLREGSLHYQKLLEKNKQHR